MEEPSERPVDRARAELLVQTLMARYGDRFRPEDREKLRDQVERLLEEAARLRAFALANADEPDPVFRAPREA